MTAHAAMRRLLADRGALALDERQTLDRHLLECPECRQVAAEYARQDRFMQSIAIPDGVGLRERVLRDVHEVSRVSRLSHRSLLPSLVPLFMALLTIVSLALPEAKQLGSAALNAPAQPIFGPAHGAFNPEGIPGAGPQSSYYGRNLGPHHGGLDSGIPTKQRAPASTGHGPPPTARASRTQHGVTIRFIAWLPQVHPSRNALIPISLAVQNWTSRPMPVIGGPRFCSDGEPIAQVLSRAGKLLYPPQPQVGPGLACPYRGPHSIAPRHSLVRHYLVVLRAGAIRASTTAGNPVRTITTPAVHIPLAPGRAPILRYAAFPAPHIRVTGLDPHGGHLFVSQDTACAPYTMSSLTPVLRQPYPDDPFWRAIAGTTVFPTCSHPHRWHLLVGQIGHPIAEFSKTF